MSEPLRMNEPNRISIRGGRVIDPANGLDAVTDLHLAEGIVVGVGEPPGGFAPQRVIDAGGLVVCPGLIDLCARLRQPGDEKKATIASETRAAAAAGITTLCCPPDTKPVADTPAVVELIKQTADDIGRTRVLTIGAISRGLKGEQITEMAALQRAGCPAVGNADRPIHNTRFQRRALEYAATYGLLSFLHPADADLSEGGLVHEGLQSTRLGLPGIPEAAETVAIARDLALAEQTGARIHFRGLSTARATEMLAEARNRGIKVSADVSAHQLFLTEDSLQGFDVNAHVIPPLRTADDRARLRAAVSVGHISAICSDHQPHEPDAKLASFPQSEPGISALETLLPLCLELVRENLLDLSSALARLTSGPADILGPLGPVGDQDMGRRIQLGRIGVGDLADICVFDPDETWTPAQGNWRSRGRNTPFWNQQFRGRAIYTLLGGRVVFDALSCGLD